MRRILSFCVLFAAVIMLLCSCARPWPELQDTVTYKERTYGELSREEQKDLNLAVDSVTELELVGEVRLTSDERQYTAYSYPDPRYPNLLVVSTGGEPRIFSFANFNAGTGDITKLLELYGLTDANTFRKLSISSQNAEEKPQLVKEITEQSLLDSLLVCISSKESAPAVPGEGDQKIGQYQTLFLDFELSNGFSLCFDLYPAELYFEAGLGKFRLNEATVNWLESNLIC